MLAWKPFKFAAALPALLLCGCIATRDAYDVPDVPVPDRYQHELTDQAGDEPVTVSAMQLANWWTRFDNERLNELVDLALANSPRLHMAARRVVQAAARAAQKDADRYPVITAPIEYRADSPLTIGTVDEGGDVETRKTISGSLRGDWSPDLWGEFLAGYRAGDYRLWNALFSYDQERQALVGEVVAAYLDYLSLNDQLRGARETAEVISGVLSSLEQRYELGDATAIDLERQKAAVYSTLTLLPTIELEKQLTANRLARLTGTLAGQLELPEDGLDAVSYFTQQPSVPSRLLLARPDVRAVEAELLAADANIDVARAQILPTFDITAQVGYGGLRLRDLFEPHTLFWRFLANIATTVFDHGKRSNEIRLMESVYQEMLQRYYMTIAEATLEVEGALASVQHNRARYLSQRQATDAARKALEYSLEVYGQDQIDYFAMLDTARTYQRHLLDVHEYNRDRFAGVIELYVSLGAGAPQRKALPGDGTRPAALQLADNAEGADLPAEEEEPIEDAPQWWQGRHDESAQSPDDDAWLVKLYGIHSSDTAGATWRMLGRLFPDRVAGHAMLAGIEESTIDQEGYQIDWYGLYVDGFESREQADAWCNALAAINYRCAVATGERIDEVERIVPWDAVAP